MNNDTKAVKAYYRSYLNGVSQYIKMSQILQDLDICAPQWARFKKSDLNDSELSVESLERIYDHIHNVVNENNYIK